MWGRRLIAVHAWAGRSRERWELVSFTCLYRGCREAWINLVAIDMWLLLLLLLLVVMVVVVVMLLAELRSLYCTWRGVVNILWRVLHDMRRMTVCHWRYLGWWRR